MFSSSSIEVVVVRLVFGSMVENVTNKLKWNSQGFTLTTTQENANVGDGGDVSDDNPVKP